MQSHKGPYQHLYPEDAASKIPSPFQPAGASSRFGQGDTRPFTARAGRVTFLPKQMSSSGVTSPYPAKSTVTPTALFHAKSICFIGQLTVEHGATVMLQALPDSTRRTAAYPVELRIDLGGLEPNIDAQKLLTLTGPAFDNPQWCSESGEWEIYFEDIDDKGA